jgi:YkoY family integral membrane protein
LNFILDFIRSQTFGTPDLLVIGFLAILEGALSIDNALVLGLLAKRLKKDEQGQALNIGMFLAFLFRFVAIFAAALLLRYTFVKLLGGGYLIYIAVRHLFFEGKKDEHEQIVLDEHGRPQIVEATGKELPPEKQENDIKERVPVYIKPDGKSAGSYASFWPTVGSIGLTDIAFAVDSILAAIALIGPPPVPGAHHPKLWVVFTGALLGMIALRFAAGLVIKLLESFPRFEIAAYLLVLVIGLKLFLDWGFNSDWSTWSPGLEKQRLASIESYEKWLEKKWIFKIPRHHQAAGPGVPAAAPAPGAPAPADPAVPAPALPAAAAPVPAAPQPPGLVQPQHLLDFHDPRRPEFITFWLSMLAALASGFIPPRKKEHGAAK